MSHGLSSALAGGSAAAISLGLTGVAVVVARASGFVDHPQGYKAHARATPYLGGAAVLLALLLSTLVLAAPGLGLSAILAGAAVLALVGTIDDRIAVAPRWRVAAEVGAAGMLFAAGVHWTATGNGVLDFILTAIWVVAIVNATNLMDNMDGAAPTVTGISAFGLGLIALSVQRPALAVLAFAVAGACLGFLPHNLAGPARIFLGDGGSMPLGFIVSALTMALLAKGPLGIDGALVGGLAVGLPILDTSLVMVSRRRRRVPFVKGGRDHLTHRLLARTTSARRVALRLAAVQLILVGLAVAAVERRDTSFVIVVAVAAVILGAGAIVLLESPAWRPRSDNDRAGDGEPQARGGNGANPGRMPPGGVPRTSAPPPAEPPAARHVISRAPRWTEESAAASSDASGAVR